MHKKNLQPEIKLVSALKNATFDRTLNDIFFWRFFVVSLQMSVQ